MRAEFNNLYNAIMKTNYGQEVVIAMEKLEQKITEVEKRIECVKRTNIDINEIVFTNQVKLEESIGYDNVEILQRSVNDINIAIELTDSEPIENNWYQLFEEPKKEEPKVIWAKGTIIEWNESVKYYNAKGGARARVTEDYTTLCETVKVEFLDDLSNGQKNGGYFGYMFKDEPIKETPPTELCKTPQTHEFVKDIIAKLKVIDVDGETMEYILEQVGMSEQMLKQLAIKNFVE